MSTGEKIVMSNFNQGSIWRKWDLHIHSPLSILNNQFPKMPENSNEPDWEQYITKLESLDISVIGITDYFTIEGYKKVLEYKEQKRLKNIDLILPNIEFRLDNVVSGRNDTAPKRLNLHVIFSDKISINDIEEHFLHEIYFQSEGNIQKQNDREKLKLANIEKLGKVLKSQDSSRSGRSDAIVGAEVITVDCDEIKQLLDSSRFRDNYCLILSSREWDLISWNGQEALLKRNLLAQCDFVFTSNTKGIKFFLGGENKQDFISKFKSLKPSLHGSDAHKIDEIGYPCSKRGEQGHSCQNNSDACDRRFCWIKADPTFEGLKQVLYEPEERVRIQYENPAPSRHNYTLKKLGFTPTKVNDNLEIAETDIPVNQGLVTITGGRGSGKTAFVDIIAHCFKDRFISNDHNSFVKRIKGDNCDLRVNLEFVAADPFQKAISDSNTIIEKINIVYISQGELEQYITERTELTKHIRDLIFSEVQASDEYEYKELEKQLEECENTLQEISNEIIEAEKLVTDLRNQELQSNKSKVETYIRDLERQISESEKALHNAENIEKAQNAQQELSQLRDTQDKLTKLKDHLDSADSLFENEVQAFNNHIKMINIISTELQLPNQTEPLPAIVYDISPLKSLLGTTKNQIHTVLARIDEKTSQLQQAKSESSKHTELLDNKDKRQRELNQVNQEIESIQEHNQKLVELRKKRKETYHQLLSLIKQMQDQYNNIIAHFEQRVRAQDILKDLDFSAIIHFKLGKFNEQVWDLFNKNKVKEDHFNKLLQLFRNYTQEPSSNLEALVDEIEKNVENNDLRDRIKTNTSIKDDDFFNAFYTNYFSIVPTVKYKNKELDLLSLGQKATVLIKLYLVRGQDPIIIDSQDDHLDNDFIVQELIPTIREAKKQRQIILVSNNANVVVNTDAEQIIIAENNDKAISFVAGSLENPDIRAKALTVLEGGKEAFEQRKRKYRLV